MRAAVTVEQCWHSVPGGTARATIELLDALRMRNDVDVIGVAAHHRRPPPPEWALPVPVRRLPLPRQLLYETWHAPRWRWPPVQQATGPVDVIHATAVAFPPTSAPVVVTVHDLAFLRDPRRATRHGHRFMRRGTDLAREHATLVLCPSHVTADDCVAYGFRPERVRVVPWGVTPIAASAADVDRVRVQYGITKRYVLFAGTVEPRKNLPRLLEAFGQVPDREVELVLVGPDGWNEDIGPGLQRLGNRARTVGFVPRRDLAALLTGAAAFCYPSLEEGFGLPVLEAMAQGAPVVTSSGTSTAEVAGDAALIVDPRDTSAIAAAIERVVGDGAVATQLAEAGRARAAQFTWARCAELVVDAYRDAIEMGIVA